MSYINTDSRSWQDDIASLNKFFYERLKDRPYWNFLEDGTPVLYEQGIRIHKKPRLVEGIAYVENVRKAQIRDKDRTYKALGSFRRIMQDRLPNDKELRYNLKLVKNSMCLLQVETSEGPVRWCIGRAKGTKAYNDELREKAEDFAKLHSEKEWVCLFLNFTCDPKLYKNRAEAWEKYKQKNVDPTIEYLRKHCGAHFVGVMESHGNGYPHCHYVVWLPADAYPQLKKMKNGTPIRYGSLYSKIRQRVPNLVFKVIKAGGPGVVGYICKYITKGIESDIFKALSTEGAFTPTQRKQIIEFLALKAFRRRKLYLQQVSRAFPKSENPIAPGFNVPTTPARESAPCSARQSRAYLIKISTKSPLCTPKNVWAMSYGDFIAHYRAAPFAIEGVTPDVAEDFKKNGRKLFDSRNFYTYFVKFLQDWEHSPLNRTFYFGEYGDIPSRKFDGYDFNDDESYMECVTACFDWYATQMMVNHYCFADLLSCREGLTDIPKLYWDARTGITYESTEANPYENFFSWEELKAMRMEKHEKKQKATEKYLTESAQRSIIEEESDMEVEE